jgi:hypothetical protein
MRRLLVLAAGVVGAAAILVTTAPAADNDVAVGCLDVVDGNITYHADGVVGGSIDLRAPACRGGAKYTLYILEESGATEPLATARGRMTANPNVVMFESRAITTTDAVICVYIETTHPKESGDRAPDVGCVDILQNTGPGGAGSFN